MDLIHHKQIFAAYHAENITTTSYTKTIVYKLANFFHHGSTSKQVAIPLNYMYLISSVTETK